MKHEIKEFPFRILSRIFGVYNDAFTFPPKELNIIRPTALYSMVISWYIIGILGFLRIDMKLILDLMLVIMFGNWFLTLVYYNLKRNILEPKLRKSMRMPFNNLDKLVFLYICLGFFVFIIGMYCTKNSF